LQVHETSERRDGVTLIPARARPWLLSFCAVLLLGLGRAFWGKPGYALSAFGDLAELSFLLVAAAFMTRNAFASQGATRIFWSFFAAGAVLWIAGLLQWIQSELVLRTPTPQTPFGDTLLFLKLVPLLAALAIEPHHQLTRRFRIFSFLDLSFLLVYWFYFYAIWVIPYRYVVHVESIYGLHFDTIDFLGHLILVAAMGFMALRAWGSWRVLYRLCFAAFALYSLSSAIANFAIDAGKYYSGGPYDVPLLTSVAGIASFAVLGGTLPPDSPHSSSSGKSSRTGILLPSRIAMLATLSAPVIGLALLNSATVSYRIGHFRVLATLLAVLILTALLSLKQYLLSSDLVRSLREASLAYDSLSTTHQRLLQTEKLASLGQIVARVANEVKKAMMVTLGASSSLLRNSAADSTTRSMAEKIIGQANRTDDLVNNMLSFACESPLEIAPVDLQQLLVGAIGLARVGRISHIHLEIKSEGPIPKVAADSSRILQVFLQMIGNSVDAMDEMDSGTLLITLRAADHYVEAEFSDTGTGLEDPERVFDPFYTTKTVGKGIGLGLSTCYGIIRQHRGDITCRNRAGDGAVFTVSLPVFPEVNLPLALPTAFRMEET